MAPKLNITDRDGFSIGVIAARVGLRTREGKISRVSAKSIWIGDRLYTDRKPGVPQRFASAR